MDKRERKAALNAKRGEESAARNKIFMALEEIFPLGVKGLDASITITDYYSLSKAWGGNVSKKLPTEKALKKALASRKVRRPGKDLRFKRKSWSWIKFKRN